MKSEINTHLRTKLENEMLFKWKDTKQRYGDVFLIIFSRNIVVTNDWFEALVAEVTSEIKI